MTTSGNAQQARDVMFWLLGSFGGVRWPEFMLVSVVVGFGLVACLLYARVLDAFAFGDEAAAALGVNVGQARIILFALTAMMTATIVSMVGSIGFVGLVVPHAARFVVGPLHSRLLPACAVAGAIFMVLADIASRILIPKQVLPIGVVTALVGRAVLFSHPLSFPARPHEHQGRQSGLEDRPEDGHRRRHLRSAAEQGCLACSARTARARPRFCVSSPG